MKRLLFQVVFIVLILVPQIVTANFLDVPYGSEYYDAIEYIKENGGIDNSEFFYPEEEITKAALYKMLLANSGFTPGDEEPKNHFTDLGGSEWYAPYANQAVEIGLIDEDQTQFDPDKKITRAQAAKIILRWGGIPVPRYINPNDWDLPYNDTNPLHIYAPYIQKIYELGIMPEYNSDYFGTYRKLTRGDAALLIYNFDLYSITDEFVIYLNSGSDIPLIETLTDVYTKLTEDFYQGGLSEDELLYTAIEEMVNSAGDPYTTFSAPNDTTSITTLLNGEYEGVGIYINQESDGTIIITSLLANSPAAEQGIKANDILMEVDGQSVEELDLNEAANLLRGKAGTTAVLLIQRGTELLEFTVERRALTITYIESQLLENNIAYYNITFFGEQTDEEFFAKTQEFLETGINGIILDVRNNPGGYVSTAANILSQFIEEGELITTISYNNENIEYISEGPGTLGTYPVVIITDEISASASEILTGALADHNIAITVGETTYGKGSVQELIYYDDGSILKITVAHWLTPNGTDINGIGIQPDIEITGEDEQLQQAIDTVTRLID
ncbi:MAG: S41 family peptidase [Patescibacteria group bacterium]|nr:S-layer homology domain-containing protein [Patescibacteria group bacterium]